MAKNLSNMIYESILDLDDTNSLPVKFAPILKNALALYGINVSRKNTIWKKIKERSNLSRFKDMLEKYDIDSIVSKRNDISVIAPDNEAIKAVEDEFNKLSYEERRNTLLLHIIDHEVKEDDIIKGNVFMTLGLGNYVEVNLTYSEEKHIFSFVMENYIPIEIEKKNTTFELENGTLFKVSTMLMRELEPEPEPEPEP